MPKCNNPSINHVWRKILGLSTSPKAQKQTIYLNGQPFCQIGRLNFNLSKNMNFSGFRVTVTTVSEWVNVADALMNSLVFFIRHHHDALGETLTLSLISPFYWLAFLILSALTSEKF